MQHSSTSSQFRRTRATPSLSASPSFSEPRSRSDYGHKSTQLLSPGSKPSTANLALNLSGFAPKKTQAGTHQFPLPKLTEYQGSKSSRWAGLTSQIARPDLTEENQYRHPKIKLQLEEFFKYREAMNQAMEREKPELVSKLLSTSEAILALYNIGVNVVTEPKSDSLWELGPLASRNDLLKGFFALIPEICKFPYSFFTKIDLTSLSFCGSMVIIKVSNKKIVETKLAHGVFPLNVFKSDERLISHFYKVVAHHLRTETREFDQKLCFNKGGRDPKEILASVMNYGATDSPQKKAKEVDHLDEASKLLRSLIAEPKSVLQSEIELVSTNGKALKEMMQDVDPSGINRKFWVELGDDSSEGVELPRQKYLTFAGSD